MVGIDTDKPHLGQPTWWLGMLPAGIKLLADCAEMVDGCVKINVSANFK